MKNLAGCSDAEKYVVAELKSAGIPVVNDDSLLKYEVSVSKAGRIGSFSFRRAWYYWVVSGNVPLKIARELYESPFGKKDIRVAGHCGCPPPEEWVTWLDEKGLELIGLKDWNNLIRFLNRVKKDLPINYHPVLKKDFKKFGKPFVTGYHIDSQEGLNLFVETLKHHQLV